MTRAVACMLFAATAVATDEPAGSDGAPPAGKLPTEVISSRRPSVEADRLQL